MEKVILLKYHMMAFAMGFVLDLIVGDPLSWPHPVRWMGMLIGKLTKVFQARGQCENPEEESRNMRIYGRVMVILVVLTTGIVTAFLLITAYRINPILGCLVEAWLTFRLLATKSLKDASMNVYYALRTGSLEDARYAVSMIVGRDTSVLDRVGVTKAAVETVAENTSDGIIAPMLYTALGGPILGMIYKSMNTMDSMVGYRNEKFMDFGRAAAKTDDVANFIPARISGVLMVGAAVLLELFGNDYFDGRNAWRIFRRDRLKHASPNAAHTEATCAGALDIEIAGDAVYFGEVHHKPTLGDAIRPIETEDIPRANRLMLMTATICEGCCLALMAVVILL
jgi:adenosylcobinamide-phosphate synthase